ncbi:PaaI family thioesterase [Tsukamurella pseudospumae]|uniref:Medium/long-chain acyl-CoA thioesterase YigI n=1 Tax=Tsukamurella pseudospumae TaxID=239498 RepID=A0A138ANT3_9ACTN|nr:PaaI family thioesterase [Tsukamurella pseudospumae]KXP00808.1 thioesterase [Tsukamurella pseudospumae]KXP12102.1 thioesterase [Tsukamurella pseudospumae]
MTGTARITLDTAAAILAAQPFNDLVGARITRFGEGEAELVLDIEDRHRQQFGVAHGGVLAYLADNVLTFAAGSVLGADVLTGGMDVSYLRAARSGRLRARASVVHRARSHAVVTVEIRNENGGSGAAALCAIARGTVFATSPRGAAA